MASLRQMVADLTARLGQPQAGAQTPATQQPGQPAGEAPPAYNLAIPPQLSEAIFNENPQIAQQGLTHLVNSLAQQIHQTVRTEFRQELTTRDQQAQQQQQQGQQTQQQEQMQRDYYGTFPAHNNPAIKQIVAHEAQQLQAAYPGLSWGPDFMNALGARVNQTVASLARQQPQAASAPAPSAAPAPFVPSSPRPMIPAGGDDLQTLMDSTMAGAFE
jgi:hypothetical protein